RARREETRAAHRTGLAERQALAPAARVQLRIAGVEDVQAERHAQHALPVGHAVGIALRVAVAAGLARRRELIPPHGEEVLLDQPLARARAPAAAARHQADEVRLAAPGPRERPR